MPSTQLILCCLLLLLPSICPSIRVFSKESVLHIRWPKFWSFSFSISPSNKYSGLISVRIDWFDLLAVQGTLKSLLQHHSLKTSTSLLHSPILTSVHGYWKNHSFDYTDLCQQSTSLLFNSCLGLSAFHQRSKYLLISLLQSPPTMILESKKKKSVTVSIVSPIYLPWSYGTRCHDLHFLNVEF